MPSTTNFGWTTPADTDYVKDGASAIRTLANGVDTSMAQLKGGTTGQILSKTNGTDMAFTWIDNDQGDITGVTAGTGISGGGTSGTVTVTNSMATAITTNGDLIYGTGSGTFSRLGIGSSNQVLTVSGGVPTWAAASSGSMTLINTGGTTLSGTTTTVSSIPSTYQQLQIRVRGVKPQSIDTVLALRLNGDTANNYFSIWQVTSASTGQTFSSSYYNINTNGLSNDTDAQYNDCWIILPDYATTTNYKQIQSLDFSKYAYAGATQNWSSSLRYGAYASTSAVSSISIYVSGTGGAVAGTVYVYGVN